MSTAKSGDTVRVAYEGTLSDGTVFDKSKEGNDLEFTLGQKQVIAGFENAIEGMNVGETKKTTIPADAAYGPYNDEAIVQVTRSQLPEGLEPEVGMQLRAQGPEGQPLMVSIKEFDANSVTLDANHPLAGKDLTFDITLNEIK